ncbi:DUF4387 domain-containing protein [uncultured Sphingomonas sp.]|uniref:DUF4387 domain-containing protein n=1 Tax=uncultured Sphingomonas sp. TaxID=158754 RepID=UPI0035CAE4E3
MPKLKDVARHVRSKNAGPFWITIDIFFHSDDDFRRYAPSSALGSGAVGALYGVPAHLLKRFEVPELLVIKLSYPRETPQGGALERDMHGGQQYVRLLDVEMDAGDVHAVT